MEYTIITKSLRTFINQVTSEYYKITIKGSSYTDEELSSQEAKRYIKEHDLKEIYRLDHNNIIWGDDDFKENCPQHIKNKLCC